MKIFDKNRIRRLQIIDKLLSDGSEGYTYSEIEMAINKKTGEPTNRFAVSRDIKMLQEELGMDIVETKGHVIDKVHQQPRKVSKWKYKHSDSALFNGNLSDEQVEFLSMALAMLGLKGIESSKLFRSLNLKANKKSTIISYTKNPIEKKTGLIFQKLLDFIKLRRVVSLTLRDRLPPYNRVTHKVHPWYLREYNRRWYLFGYDEKEKTVSHYALDRMMSSIRELSVEWQSPDKTIEEILEDVIGVSLSEGDILDIVFWVSDKSADFVVHKPLHHSQSVVTESDPDYTKYKFLLKNGGNLFRLKCKENYELRREMISFGAELIVVSPLSLRDQIKAQLEDMIGNYQLFCEPGKDNDFTIEAG